MRVVYDSNRDAHLIREEQEVSVRERDLAETLSSLCGANYPADGLFLDAEGMRLTDELRDASLCRRCFGIAQRRGVTIPGFLVDGDPVGEAERIAKDSPLYDLED